jgi:phage replication initiation protein
MSYPLNSNIGLIDVDSSTESNPSVVQPHMDAPGVVMPYSPHIVIRGESTTHDYLEHIDSETAHIDWFAFTFRYDQLHKALKYLKIFLENIFHISPQAWLDTKSGWNGYSTRINLGRFGLLAYGGDSQKDTIHIEINGTGCGQVDDWVTVAAIGEAEDWKITRSDLAYDDFDGITVNINLGKQWFKDGLFTNSGRPPKATLIDDFDSGDGKTLNIGNRKNGKLLRVYEKGKQLGDPNSPWCRAEVELRSKDRTIPWEILYKPGQYLAGSYKALNFISLKQSKLETNKKTTTIKYESMVRWIRMAAGKGINVMSLVEGGDIYSVFEQIIRDGYPTRLMDLEDYLPVAEVKES